MKIKYSIFLSLFLLITSHCAYFNTFYNAKRYYAKAFHATLMNRTQKVNSTEKTNYQKAIEKASKLVRMYPNSKYVDDALLLMGKSYYHQQEYHQAIRKFLELRNSYPNSELIQETNLWLAKSDLGLEDTREAETKFNQLIKQDLTKTMEAEVYYYLAKLYEENMEFEKAIEAYKKTLETGENNLKQEAAFAIALNYDTLKIYDKSAEYFNKVLDFDPLKELRFNAQFRYAQSIKKLGQFDRGIQLFQKLLVDEQNKAAEAQLRLEIAECLAFKQDIDGAIIAYRDIIEDFKRNIHTARAHYALGNIYEVHRMDYNRALDYFNETQTQMPNSVYADTAKTKARDIQRMQALQQVIEMAKEGTKGELIMEEEEVQEDSLVLEDVFTMLDTTRGDTARYYVLVDIGGKAFADSILEERRYRERENDLKWRDNDQNEKEDLPVDWVAWYQDGEIPSFDNLSNEFDGLRKRLKDLETRGMTDNPDLQLFRVEELDKNLFFLAELYLFRFSLIDSAEQQYHKILDMFPESEYSARALYNLAYIRSDIDGDTSGAHLYLHQIVDRYSESQVYQAALKTLGEKSTVHKSSNLMMLFQEAEDDLWQKNQPEKALRIYKRILIEYPNSSLIPKAMYALGWIYESRLGDSDQAIAAYDSLLNQYPDSEYAKAVQPKLLAVQAEYDRLEAEEKARVDSLNYLPKRR